MIMRIEPRTGPDHHEPNRANADFLGELHMLAESIGSSTSEPIEAFVLDDEKKVNWVVRKIVEARAYRQRVKRWAEHEQHGAEAEEERLLFLFGNQLEMWAATEIAKLNGRRKSLHLP